MTYTIEFPDEVWDQVHALPAEAATPFAEVMTLLTHEPWHGEPYHRANPDGALRQLIYGFGHEATLDRLRMDRKLEEALTHRVDPLHLALVFGIDEKTAIRYANSTRQLLTTAAECDN